MLVFDLPSLPLRVQGDQGLLPGAKETTREQIKAKYLLVKLHDRVGRMADTLEYTDVAFPRARFDEELRRRAAPLLRRAWSRTSGDALVIRHLYIERRMMPLNIYLQEATPTQIAAVVVEYGNAIKDLVRANIFPGDMLCKNFGVTRHGRVVFYDYDEIEYLTDCNFRKIPRRATRKTRCRPRSGTGSARATSSRRASRRSCSAIRGARALHCAPCRPARPGILARPQAGNPGRLRA